MAKKKHLNLLKQGVEAWNQWRQEHPELQPDLSRAELREVNLVGADLSFADLSQAELTYADLSESLQLHLFVDSVLSSQLEVRLRS